MDGVCRLCLADTETCKEYTSYDGRIQLLMPEIDLNITPTFILCENCSNKLNSAYIFKQKCLQIEERIKNYISKTRRPLTNLRCVKDKNYGNGKESFDTVIVEEAYDDLENDSITNLIYLEDYKDIHSITEEYHLTFPKEEFFQQHEDECASNPCKEEIEEGQENKSLKAFICEICTASFNKSIELDQHSSLHSETNTFPCDSCNKKFTKEADLTQHKLIHSNKAFRYFCDICNKGFKKKPHLDNHNDMHSKKMSTCSICSKSCRHLRRHIVNCHMRKHLCEVCGRKFGTEHVLQKHIRTHSNLPYKCRVCQKGFLVKRIWEVHMRTHRLKKPYTCNICQEVYELKASYNAHVTIHKLEWPFVCEITTCNMRFRRADSFRKHMRRHQFGRRYQCNVCDKSYFDATGLKYHMTCHTGERPYKCNICHGSFSLNAGLRRHLRTHRAKIVYTNRQRRIVTKQ